MNTLKEYYEKQHLKHYDQAESMVTLVLNNLNLETCSTNQLDFILNQLKENQPINQEHMIGLLRYLYLKDYQELYTHLATLLGGIGVMESIKETISKKMSHEIAEKIFLRGMPEIASSLAELSHYTGHVMEQLKFHCKDNCFKVLARNHHKIPESTQIEEKKIYLASTSFEEYLADRHKRKVEELKHYQASGTVWYEQIVTDDMIQFVESNQEVLSGKLIDNKLYVTKIPYKTDAYLHANDDLTKRFNYCHCAFAKGALLDPDIKIDPDWCYCSAGFAKFPFEVILEKKLEVTVLKSVLRGDDVCRFMIEVEDTWEK